MATIFAAQPSTTKKPMQHTPSPRAFSCRIYANMHLRLLLPPYPLFSLLFAAPHGVLDMKNKDTGDTRGDTSFVLSRRTVAYECKKDPNSFLCNGVTQFDGDDKNSTDLVVAFTIEVDGQWGPYLPCNPVDTKKPEGPWRCDVEIGGGGTPTPPQCKAHNFSTYGNHCWKGYLPETVQADTEGDCCNVAAEKKRTRWQYFQKNKTCTMFRFALEPIACEGGTLGYYDTSTPPCNCSRVHKTVGRENLTLAYAGYTQMHPAGGIWYSHPEQGECTGTQRPGDGSGCTWRVSSRNRVVKASCVYGHLDDNVVAHNKACFQGCPQPNNVTSDCYLGCYSHGTDAMTKEELAAPWDKAFQSEDQSKGGCPIVKV